MLAGITPLSLRNGGIWYRLPPCLQVGEQLPPLPPAPPPMIGPDSKFCTLILAHQIFKPKRAVQWRNTNLWSLAQSIPPPTAVSSCPRRVDYTTSPWPVKYEHRDVVERSYNAIELQSCRGRVAVVITA